MKNIQESLNYQFNKIKGIFIKIMIFRVFGTTFQGELSYAILKNYSQKCEFVLFFIAKRVLARKLNPIDVPSSYRLGATFNSINSKRI
ncbi:hypothetical protein H5410_043033 [Solanum commersonii]|uniref:Uncharacterized protein n=1 Tax=Solanum commersonii TaxID=4109 RepID=A0A9J5XY28_SOLCO|nr:hypothetical protein H5410_043033 [Solanum commersonii]